MEPKLISNQVYEAIQVPTLEEDMPSKSTILYANRYAGVQEVEMTDPELVDLINSSIGMAGSNVLVQLKQKMEKFRNGPWYIDSRDGVVYIHNRKLNQESVTNYIYQQENGELLSASFNMIEVFKPFAGVSSFINSLTKAVDSVTTQLADYQVQLQKQVDDLRFRHVEPLDSIPDYRARANEQYGPQMEWESKRRAAAWEGRKQKRQYDAKDPATIKAESQARAEQSYARANKRGMAQKYLTDMNPCYNNYRLMCEQYGTSSNQAKRAWQEVENYAKNQTVELAPNEGVWDYYNATIAVGQSVTSPSQPATEPSSSLVQKAIEAWKNSHPGFQVVQTLGTSWKKGKKEYFFSDYHTDDYSTGYKWSAFVTFKYFGVGTKKAVVRADRLLRDTHPRYSTPNLGATLQNAAGNVGRGKKEKRLQAELRVVGNPTLESMQQIGIYNVGKKYSGPWYIKSVDHSFEFGQGYICDIELSKQVPKPGSSGETTSVDSKEYTKDNGTPTVKKSTVTSTSGKKGGKGSTGGQRSKANTPSVTTRDGSIVISQWDAATMEVVSSEMATARSDAEAQKILDRHARQYVANDKRNKAKGTNTPYAKFGSTKRNKDGTYSTKVTVNQDAKVDAKDPTPITITGTAYNDIWVMTNQKREQRKKK